jgi:hypothetical protein
LEHQWLYHVSDAKPQVNHNDSIIQIAPYENKRERAKSQKETAKPVNPFKSEQELDLKVVALIAQKLNYK